ncbi:hypothetical protein BH11PSE4_BH11PSE4_08930 [soil metagenome]
MFAQVGAKLAAVRSVAGRVIDTRNAASVAIIAGTLALAGCVPTTAPLAGADPADPSARVAGVGYRSTVVPYTTLRPVAPSPWREQNDRVAPASKSGR